ncbi:MAG: Ig-like domain-containing protein [Gemmatimonadales bacterium]|nr:Ig-like domain-containing protein [Gemmatimonadales bacterium]
MPKRRLHLLLVAVPALVALGCNGGDLVLPSTVEPANIEILEGDDQVGTPGQPLPDDLVVRLVDTAGIGVPGQSVTWVVATGGGNVSPATSTTNRDGLASAEWTLGPAAGPNTVSAVVAGIGGVTFSALGSEDDGDGGEPSATRSGVSADPTTIEIATGTATITVMVRDGSGDPVQGAEVELEASGGGNTLTQPSGPTGPDGVATGTLRSTVAGTKVVSATVNGSVEVRETARVTVTQAPATTIVALEGDGQTAPAGSRVPIKPAVRVTDDAGRPVGGVEVTFVVTGGGGSVSGAVRTTGSDGVARVGDWTLGQAAGPNTLEARAGSLQGSPVVFRAEATAVVGTVARFEFRIQPRDVDEDEPFTVAVALVDANGDVVPLSGVLIYLGLFREGRDTPSNSDLEGERFRPTENGVAVFSGLRVSREGDDYRLRALSDDFPDVGPAFSVPFDID